MGIEPSDGVGISEESSQKDAGQEWRVRWWVESPIEYIVWAMAGLT